MADYLCTYCQNPILSSRIQCAECPDFDLCLQCFACGAETGPHKKEHKYNVLDNGYLAIFDTGGGGGGGGGGGDGDGDGGGDEEEWTSREEEALLEAIEQYGFGNWEDVGTYVKTKTVDECLKHYYAYFIHGNVGKVTFPTERKPCKVKDHSCPDGGPLSPSLTIPIPPLELSLQEQQELGYMPLRDDFEREYDNDAESGISGLAINYDDEDLDIAFKIAQVDMYRYRLKERQRRKNIAREYNLIAASTTAGIKKEQVKKKKLSKDEKEFQDRMRVFTQFHTASDHEQFFESLRKEKQIKARIKELMRLRRNGIQKVAEIAEYESEKSRRDKRKEHKKKLPYSTAKRTSMGTKKSDENDEENREDTTGEKYSVNNAKETSTIPCSELLSETEKKLCHSISMRPASYVTIKTCIIKDYLQRRQGFQVKIRYPSHLDKTHRRKIMNFLSENGWIGGVGAY